MGGGGGGCCVDASLFECKDNHALVFLHSSLVSAQESLAIWTLVSHRVEGFNATWHAGAGPQPDDAEDSGKDPSQRSWLRVCAGANLALAMRADHIHRIGSVVGWVDHHHHLLGSRRGCWHALHVRRCASGNCSRRHVGLRRRHSPRQRTTLHLLGWGRGGKPSGSLRCLADRLGV